MDISAPYPFSRLLRTLRAHQGLSQAELARRSNAFTASHPDLAECSTIYASTIGKLETDTRRPDRDVLYALASGLGIPVAQLMPELPDLPEQETP